MKTDANMEKYSSAVSLSDMEIFVFPDLMYSLVLANIMSPVIWKWKDHKTFKKLANKSPYRRLTRLRQFIMDEYEFNLDLDTWGLTDKDVELNRFKDFISAEDIGASNALFGYHGDEYYFDIGIRKHFGLDKYQGDVIPYWKTETVEAMDAFKYKQNYTMGAGECVSLAALYMAAAFVVCDVPLDDMFMILTPLHSQNFLDVSDGVLTNNRRILTKSMWFNGTAITFKAQRAIRNEQVTVVSHPSGYIHCFYDEATIDPEAYDKFAMKLKEFLVTEIDIGIFANFLRCYRDYQKYFVFCRHHRGNDKFVNAEILFHYEHGSDLRIANDTIDKLFSDVSDDDFSVYKTVDKLCVEEFLRMLRKAKLDLTIEADAKEFSNQLAKLYPGIPDFTEDLASFIKTEPKLPSHEKKFVKGNTFEIMPGMSRKDIINHLKSIREDNVVADLAFYAFRDMTECDWEPFIKASIERCPVALEMANGKTEEEVFHWINSMECQSIYDGSRLSHPDEVVNFGRGDGVEKAVVMANVLFNREPDCEIKIEIDNEHVGLIVGERSYEFNSVKQIKQDIIISRKSYKPYNEK